MRLLLVRHAQSEWNAARRLQGQADIGLSELGMAQAEALRATIDAVAPCRSVASDLKRVRETAERINATFVRYTTGLREISAGDWTGRVIDDIRAEDGDAFQNWRAGTHAPPGSESWPAFVDRVAGVIVNRRAKLTPYRRPKLTPLVVSRSGPEPTELITEWRRVRP